MVTNRQRLLSALAPVAQRLGLRADRVDDRTLLVQKRDQRRRVVKRVGGPRGLTWVVFEPRAMRRSMARVQRWFGDWLGHQHLAWVLDRLEANVVLDVGANAGQFGKGLREAGYRGRIISFEPTPEAFEKLRANAANDPGWEVFNCALGTEDTTSEINIAGGPGKMSSLLPASDFGQSWSSRLVDNEQVTIDVRRLDGLFDELIEGMEEPRVFLKMDTQGFDLEVLRGAGTKADALLGLQSELALVPIYDGMPRMPEQLQAYEAAGFEVSGLFPVTVHPQSMRAIEFDVIMVRPEHVRPERRPA